MLQDFGMSKAGLIGINILELIGEILRMMRVQEHNSKKLNQMTLTPHMTIAPSCIMVPDS